MRWTSNLILIPPFRHFGVYFPAILFQLGKFPLIPDTSVFSIASDYPKSC